MSSMLLIILPNDTEERMVAQEKINECGMVLISEAPDDNWEEFLEEEKRD